MALALTLGFSYQIHLNITLMRHIAQVILAHQSVEINRCSRAGVQLYILHFGHFNQFVRQRFQYGQRLFGRSAFRHIHHDLKFRLIVERQHFQHHQFEYRQCDGQYNQTGNGSKQQDPFFTGLRTLNKRAHQPVEEFIQFALLRVFFVMRMGCVGRVTVQQFVGQPGRYHKGDHQ